MTHGVRRLDPFICGRRAARGTVEPVPRRAEVVVSRRDRVVVLGALAGLTAVSWLYLLRMGRMPASDARGGRFGADVVLSCCGVDLWATFLMWVVMMVGMMMPSATPMVLTFTAMNRKRSDRRGPYIPTAAFVLGYIGAWTAFSAVAAVGQWALFQASLLNPHSQTVGPWLAAALLACAGLFQFTSAKQACLMHCRSPLGFFVGYWRGGSLGALQMGLCHGAFCVGCCWLLMTLLFVAGVMNLLWVAAIAGYVLAEKVLPGGARSLGWVPRLASSEQRRSLRGKCRGP